MPYKVDFKDRGDAIIDAVCRVLSRGGVPALSLRAVATEMDMSASSILHQFGDRARLLHVAALHTGNRRLHGIEWFAVRSGPGAFLPAGPDELDRDRVWLCFTELSRAEGGLLAGAMTHMREEEWRILARATGIDDAAPELVALAAMIDGLVAAMVTGDPPLSLDRARRALGDHLRMLGLAREQRPASPGPPAESVLDERSITLERGSLSAG